MDVDHTESEHQRLTTLKIYIQFNTYKSYNQMIQGKIKRYFGDRPQLTVGSIKAKDIEKFYAHLFSDGVTANTVIHYHAVLHKAFACAFRDT